MVEELLATKKKLYQQQGDNFPNWVLDKLNIETMFANRVAMGRGLSYATLPLGCRLSTL